MTMESIVQICEENEGFKTPNLNHQLILHRRGFRKIENLDAFVNVKTLYLEGNSISKIENLSPLEHLRALYLQDNCIGRELGLENLAQVPLLIVLNLEGNGIKSLDGLPRMGSLETLMLRNNEIEDITPILQSLRLTTIDLSCNAISDKCVLDQLGQLEDLKVLYMKDNPLIKTTSFYRKRTLAKVPNVTYLDDRPIFPNEKRLSQAWMRGGRKAEDEEREIIRKEQEISGKVMHYTMDEEELFSDEDPGEVIVDAVRQYSISVDPETPSKVNQESVVDGNVIQPEKISPPSDNKTEKEDKAMNKENEYSNQAVINGKAGFHVNKGQWTEILDNLLTMHASAYNHDFEEVAEHIKIVAVSESFDPEFFSHEECYKRWKLLDERMRNETWAFPEAPEACTDELRIAEANRNYELSKFED